MPNAVLLLFFPSEKNEIKNSFKNAAIPTTVSKLYVPQNDVTGWFRLPLGCRPPGRRIFTLSIRCLAGREDQADILFLSTDFRAEEMLWEYS